MSPELALLGAAVLAQLPQGSSLELVIRLPTGGGVSIKNLEPDRPIEAIALEPETPRRRLPRPEKPDRRAQGERLRPVRLLRPAPTVDDKPKAPAKGPGKGRKFCPACHESCGASSAVCPGLNCTHIFRIDGGE